MTIMAWLLATGLRRIEKPYLARVRDPADVRRSFDQKARLFFAPRRAWALTQTRLGDRPALEVDPPATQAGTQTGTQAGADPGRVLFYIHGGAYLFGSPATHAGLAGALAARLGCSAVLPTYRLAPEHPFPAALQDVLAAWRALAREGQRITLAGDSAGGGLALALLAALGPDDARPDAVILFSPLTDLAFTGASVTQNRDADPLLPATRVHEMADMYLAGSDPRDPGASPLYGAPGHAAQVIICVDDTEILRDDGLRMADLMRAHGLAVHLIRTCGLPHVWPFFWRYLPEARATLDAIAARLTPVP